MVHWLEGFFLVAIASHLGWPNTVFSSFCGDREISLLAPLLYSEAIQIGTNPVTSKHFVNFEHPASDQNKWFPIRNLSCCTELSTCPSSFLR